MVGFTLSSSFLFSLNYATDNGVTLCKFASMCGRPGELFFKHTHTTHTYENTQFCTFATASPFVTQTASEMQVDVQAASGSKEAIQNMVTFNDTMKLLGAPDSLRIPPESLVLVRLFIYLFVGLFAWLFACLFVCLKTRRCL